jgi:1,4-dihydroxy-2-naphthoyl-CoA hydrolase
LDPLSTIEQNPIPFAKLLGIRFIGADQVCVRAEMTVREDLCTSPPILHGGAIMAFADTLGACATVINLCPNQGTATLESKTNFIAAAPSGSKVTGECSAIHRGRRTMVWQTRITSESGKLIAIVTQTQMVLDAPGAKKD